MPKRIPIILLFTMVLAIVALFVATQALAEGDPCADKDPSHCDCDGYYCVEIVEPFPQISNNSSKYTYKITYLDGSHDNPYGAGVLIPENLVADTSEGNDGWECSSDFVNSSYDCKGVRKVNGAGDTYLASGTKKFGQFINSRDVWRWNLGGFSGYTNPPPGTSGTVSLTLEGKLGTAPTDFAIRADYNCTYHYYAILGPAPFTPLGDYAAGAVGDITTVKDIQIMIERDPKTGCGTDVKWSEDGGTTWLPADQSNEPPKVDGTPIVNCDDSEARSGCLQECTITFASSPGWTWVNLGGTWYKVWIP